MLKKPYLFSILVFVEIIILFFIYYFFLEIPKLERNCAKYADDYLDEKKEDFVILSDTNSKYVWYKNGCFLNYSQIGGGLTRYYVIMDLYRNKEIVSYFKSTDSPPEQETLDKFNSVYSKIFKDERQQ